MPFTEHECPIEEMMPSRGRRCSKERHTMIALFQRPRLWNANQLQGALSHTSRATVYNNLKVLLDHHLIRKTVVDGAVYFERVAKDHHDHQLCDSCAVAECVPCPLPGNTPHSLSLFKNCRNCR